jgi:hypothetical protein
MKPLRSRVVEQKTLSSPLRMAIRRRDEVENQTRTQRAQRKEEKAIGIKPYLLCALCDLCG